MSGGLSSGAFKEMGRRGRGDRWGRSWERGEEKLLRKEVGKRGLGNRMGLMILSRTNCRFSPLLQMISL
jgi:hypothetical protein